MVLDPLKIVNMVNLLYKVNISKIKSFSDTINIVIVMPSEFCNSESKGIPDICHFSPKTQFLV